MDNQINSLKRKLTGLTGTSALTINAELTKVILEKNNILKFKLDEVPFNTAITTTFGPLKAIIDGLSKNDIVVPKERYDKIKSDVLLNDRYALMEWWKQSLTVPSQDLVHVVCNAQLVLLAENFKKITQDKINKVELQLLKPQLVKIQKFYQTVLIPFFEDYADLPANKTENYQALRIHNIRKLVIEIYILPNFFGVIIGELFKDLRYKSEFSLDVKSTLIRKTINDIIKSSGIDKYLYADYCENMVSVITKWFNDLSDPLIGKKEESFNQVILDKLLNNGAYTLDKDMDVIKGLKKQGFTYYREVLKEILINLDDLLSTYERYIRNDLQIIDNMIMFCDMLSK